MTLSSKSAPEGERERERESERGFEGGEAGGEREREGGTDSKLVIKHTYYRVRMCEAAVRPYPKHKQEDRIVDVPRYI